MTRILFDNVSLIWGEEELQWVPEGRRTKHANTMARILNDAIPFDYSAPAGSLLAGGMSGHALKAAKKQWKGLIKVIENIPLPTPVIERGILI